MSWAEETQGAVWRALMDHRPVYAHGTGMLIACKCGKRLGEQDILPVSEHALHQQEVLEALIEAKIRPATNENVISLALERSRRWKD